MPKAFTNHATTAVAPEQPRRYAGIPATAKYAQVNESTIRRMIDRGELRVYRLGQRVVRVDLTELDALMERNAGRRPQHIGE